MRVLKMKPYDESIHQYMMNQEVIRKRTFKFNSTNLDYLKSLAKNIAGIKIEANKESAVYNRLVRRLRTLDLVDFTDYCHLLEENPDERTKFINLISNSLTSFFREKYHFDHLERIILPTLLAKKQKIRIWSAGCSTGEEPYSIAITVNKLLSERKDIDIKILATDINTDSLETAERGIYDLGQLSRLSSDVYKYFNKGTGENAGLIKINDNIQKMVTFRYLNLINKWPMHNQFDIIFCRNVLIYISKHNTKEILANIENYLTPGGYLFLGHAESAFHLSKNFIPLGRTIHQKIDDDED